MATRNPGSTHQLIWRIYHYLRGFISSILGSADFGGEFCLRSLGSYKMKGFLLMTFGCMWEFSLK